MNYDHVFLTARPANTSITRDGATLRRLTEIAAVRTDNHGNVLAAFSESLVSTPAARSTRTNAVFDRMREVIIEGSELQGDMAFEPSFVTVCWRADSTRTLLRVAMEHEVDSETDAFFTFHGWIDLMQLSWPLAYHDMIGDRTLDSLCASFGFTVPKRPSVDDECRALVKAYWALMARYKAALVGEEVVRQVGGKPLQTFRKILGWG